MTHQVGHQKFTFSLVTSRNCACHSCNPCNPKGRASSKFCRWRILSVLRSKLLGGGTLLLGPMRGQAFTNQKKAPKALGEELVVSPVRATHGGPRRTTADHGGLAPWHCPALGVFEVDLFVRPRNSLKHMYCVLRSFCPRTA